MGWFLFSPARNFIFTAKYWFILGTDQSLIKYATIKLSELVQTKLSIVSISRPANCEFFSLPCTRYFLYVKHNYYVKISTVSSTRSPLTMAMKESLVNTDI